MKKSEVQHTSRGFEFIEFKDLSGNPCSLQQSSFAGCQDPGTSAIWVGCDSADPKVLASKAGEFGIETQETTGWVSYPIPEDVLLTTRMHLDRKQVEGLIEVLQRWLQKGSFKE